MSPDHTDHCIDGPFNSLGMRRKMTLVSLVIITTTLSIMSSWTITFLLVTVPQMVREYSGLMASQQPNLPVTFPKEIPHLVIRMVTHLTKGEVYNHP